MKKFWRGYTKDGGIISEALGAKWDECKNEIVKLELVLLNEIVCLKGESNEQIISLPKGMDFIQGKTATGDFQTGKCEIESRYIGWKKGNSIVKIRVDEKTNNISLEIDS